MRRYVAIGLVVGLTVFGGAVLAPTSMLPRGLRPPGSGAGTRTAPAPLIPKEAVRLLPAPPRAALQAPDWVPALGELTVTLQPWDTFLASAQTVHALRLDGSNFRRLPFPPNPDFAETWVDGARPLPDGRLAYREVNNAPARPPRRWPQDAIRLMAYDFATGEAAPLAGYPIGFRSGCPDYAPDMRAGVINGGEGLFERLHWVRPGGLEPLPLPLERLGCARWSPDGRLLATSGAPPDGPNRRWLRGHDRLDLVRELYLLSPDGRIARTLVGGLKRAGTSEWSPDGRWLAAALDFRDGSSGLWLIEVATGARHLLLAGEQFGGVAWLPGGRELVAAVGVFGGSVPSYEGPVGLYVVDLTAAREHLGVRSFG